MKFARLHLLYVLGELRADVACVPESERVALCRADEFDFFAGYRALESARPDPSDVVHLLPFHVRFVSKVKHLSE